MITVYNMYGTKIDYDVAVELMDDEIREDLASELVPCSKQDFFSAYEIRHVNKYNELWELSKLNPQY